jgi:hypothetical protein
VHEGSSLDGGDVTLLAQQELVEPAPVRRLIVPRGHSAWWGVDPSTRRVAVASVSRAADGSLVRWAASQPFRAAEGPERLAAIHAMTRQFVWALMQGGAPAPGLVLVEQPGGEHRNYELFYAVGTLAAALHASLENCYGSKVQIEFVVPSWWKKRAVGRGNIYKPKAHSGEPYGVLTWARQNGYAGSSWDEADAWGIAEAARREVALEER